MNKRYIIEVSKDNEDEMEIALSASGFHNPTIKVGMMNPIPIMIIRSGE